MDTREWLQKYLSKEKYKGRLLLVGIVMLLVGLIAIGESDGDTMGIILFLFFGGGGAYCIYKMLSSGSATKSWLTMMEREGLLPGILTDFRDAGDYFGGELRLGREWCFGKGSKIPVRYEQIQRVYQYVHSTNGSEDRRMLQVVTVSGTEKEICDMPLKGKGNEDLDRVLNFLLSKNPSIQIGYNK